MRKLKQCDTQTLVRVAAWKLLMAYCAALVSMQLQWTALIVRGLGDMLCLNRREARWKRMVRRKSVSPAKQGGLDGQTEVIPAKAPAASRVGVSNVFCPSLVNSWRERKGLIFNRSQANRS